MSNDLLLEIGTEELPASFVTHALAVMEQTAKKLLDEARLSPTGIRTLGTPRRLALLVTGVPDRQPDRKETVMGPPWSAAFKPDGTITPAGEGFAKKQGVSPDAIRPVETPKGKYVSIEVEERGKATSEVLPGLLATLCQRITFPKAMRWGQGDVAFGRPIHWILALHGASVVPFEFAHVASGRSSRGHRFLAPSSFEVDEAGAYVRRLEEAHVLVDASVRRTRMHEALLAKAKELGGELVEDAFLLEECTSLVEEPHVVPGTIEAQFLDLPDEVIVSVMRTHQRYFAVKNPTTGRLLPTYLNVVNTAKDPATIARGNDNTLRARLKDAKFFVGEDRKKKLGDAERSDRLGRVVFQAKLGTVGQKIARIGSLAEHLVPDADAATKAELALAAKLAKADLTTYIVGEFPELQGVMGRVYAKEVDRTSDAVADAIRDHYKPAGAEDDVPRELLGAVVAVADRLDTLVGCFGIGLVPTGSADPFALRRAALGIVRIALEGPIDVDLARAITLAHDFYASQGTSLRPLVELEKALDEFFRGRLRVSLRERYAADVVDACLDAWPLGSIRDLRARLEALSAFREAPEYTALAVAFKRAYNIAKDTAPGAIRPELLESGPEADLHDAFREIGGLMADAVASRRYQDALRLLGAHLRGPIDEFFEKVFVMVEDAAVRENRLRLLRGIADAVNHIAHFHLLST